MKGRHLLLGLVAGFALAFALQASAQAAPGDILYEDDFEGYTLGTHPAPWEEVRGNDDDVVTDEWAAGGLQSFVSVSTDNLNVKRAYLDLTSGLPLPDYFCYEATVHTDAATQSTAAVGFVVSDPRYPGEFLFENAVVFRADGKIMWYGPVSEQIGLWSAGTSQTFTVKVEINFLREMAHVWINGRDGGGYKAWAKTIPAESVYGAEIALDRLGFGLAHNFRGSHGRVFIDDVTLQECDFVPCAVGGVRITPRTINLRSRGRVITAIIELAAPLDATNIDLSKLYITHNGTDKVYALPSPTYVRDLDRDGLPERVVKFPRQDVQPLLPVGDEVVLTVGGEVFGGECFQGEDTVRVIYPGKQNQNNNRNKEKHEHQVHFGTE